MGLKNQQEGKMEVPIVVRVFSELLNQKDIREPLVDSGYQPAITMMEDGGTGGGNMPNIEPGSDEIPF